ncbi:dephospho-CoA kinase [Chitinilyticum litopenaei]|uniref:Dephospho-CoA kinase n=1 Tax=Chitinilyticum piscinae TaxID=2866724 RepID=A0A8J7FIQ5_9NEIS|nr:dephospho-CoA kinase [Chitinilyticum piscinae]
MIVGMTGGIGSGKSTAAELFAKQGAPVIDADQIAHQLTGKASPATESIAKQLGEHWLDKHRALNRSYARQQIFTDPQLKARLEQILHPLILSRIQDWLAEQTFPYAIIVVPLLLEIPSFHALAQRSLLIDCPEALQIQRVAARSGLSTEEIQRIIASQMPAEDKRQLCSDIISNQGSVDTLRKAIETLHERYLLLGKA